MKKKLLFSDKAWDKMIYMRNKSSNEVGGWGVTKKDDPFYVEDFKLVKQIVGPATVDFDDDGNTKFCTEMVEAGFDFSQFQKIWIHTHPGDCSLPSSVDIDTFKRMVDSLSPEDYAIMFIIAQNDTATAKMAYKSSSIGVIISDLAVEYEVSDKNNKDYDQEYDSLVSTNKISMFKQHGKFPSWEFSQHKKTQYLKLKAQDLPLIYFNMNINSYTELDNHQEFYLRERFGPMFEVYIKGLEDQLYHFENGVDREVIESILKKYNVKRLKNIKNVDIPDILRDYCARWKTLLRREKELFGGR